MEHNHKTHEEVTQCAISFGQCWQQASKLSAQKENHKPHNKPNGTPANDQRFN